MSGAKCALVVVILSIILQPTRVCLVLPVSVIDTINEHGGGGFNFFCPFCRLEEKSGSNGLYSGSVVDGSSGLVLSE